jgi:putative Mn2+ efflux pump MntP
LSFLGRAALFVVGLILLAPGACSLGFLATGMPLFPSVFTTPLTADVLSMYAALAGVWTAGVLLGAFGLWLIWRSFRPSRGR